MRARSALSLPLVWCSCSLSYVTPSAPAVWREARVGMRIRCCGQGLRFSLRGCAHVGKRALFCGYGLWARLRLPLRGPGAQRHCVRWYADTAFGQGLRLSLRGPGTHVFSAGHHRRPGLLHEAWCSVGPCAQAQGQGVLRHQGRGRGGGVAGSLTSR